MMTENAFEARVGSKLTNGDRARLHTKANGAQCVLADEGGAQPYVTWALDNDGKAFRGHYFCDLTEAAQDLVER
jgi:hypothetical protein